MAKLSGSGRWGQKQRPDVLWMKWSENDFPPVNSDCQTEKAVSGALMGCGHMPGQPQLRSRAGIQSVPPHPLEVFPGRSLLVLGPPTPGSTQLPTVSKCSGQRSGVWCFFQCCAFALRQKTFFPTMTGRLPTLPLVAVQVKACQVTRSLYMQQYVNCSSR